MYQNNLSPIRKSDVENSKQNQSRQHGKGRESEGFDVACTHALP